MSARFATLEEVVRDPVFPEVDVALRRGRHIDREDSEWYGFILDAQDHLEPLYRRYGCELVAQSDGYFYLLPTGDRLSRRHLGAGEMLVGQTLALAFLDPGTVSSGGLVTREQVLTRLGGLIGARDLARALEPRRRRFDDERVLHEIIRKRVSEALRRLDSLGFIDVLDEDHLRLRSPLLRFADPVRGLEGVAAAMERLIQRGDAVDLGAEVPDEEEAPDEEDDGENEAEEPSG
jgi:chromosome partition protein MukE